MITCLEAPPSFPAEAPPRFVPCEFRVRWADTRWELDQARALRRAVFCAEQGIFDADDRDAIDADAQTIVALSCVGGAPDRLVGTVRIHEAGPGRWWGSRLAVHAAFRHHGAIGPTLIRLAVGSARARGCHAFSAHVQEQNVPLFERLHWRSIGRESVHGRPHRRMQAELVHYPPCFDVHGGLVTRSIDAA